MSRQLIVMITEKTERALGVAAILMGLSRTDALNRAVQLYDVLIEDCRGNNHQGQALSLKGVTVTYTQTLWTAREARHMINGWLDATRLIVPANMDIEIITAARVNQWRLADCGMTGTFKSYRHKLRFWLPKIVLCAGRRNLDPITLFKDTTLHEFAHLKHNEEIFEKVYAELDRRGLSEDRFYEVMRGLIKGKSYHSGHGEGWRKWCDRTGATPRATVETQIRSLGGAVEEIPIKDALTHIKGYPIPTVRTQIKGLIERGDLTVVRAKPGRGSSTLRVATKPCDTCFTVHGPGQRSCW